MNYIDNDFKTVYKCLPNQQLIRITNSFH